MNSKNTLFNNKKQYQNSISILKLKILKKVKFDNIEICVGIQKTVNYL
jgi:hypothetical protein